jgi:predicted phosphoadenosine phosphosulfate sulfurtransferase
MKIYDPCKTVLEAARERISILFDNFETINVSISSGKDSTVLFYLALQEAKRRNRKIHAFFLDQEAEYQATVDIIKNAMSQKNVIPKWFQVPLYMTNSTSYSDYFLYAWGENEEWMREKDPIAIHSIEEDYPKRFYKFFEWYEQKNKDAAYLVGLRAEEGITRYRAVTKNPGWNGYNWSTTSNSVHKFYPIYDWSVYDVWKFIFEYNLPYNKIYDHMFWDNYGIYQKMRVSNLIHEKSYKCLVDLPKYEPDTYNKLCKRISGISSAARYASEKLVFSNKKLPKHYKTWKEFRDFLLLNIQNEDHKNIFIKRFEKQKKTEKTYQAQVGQLLINDYENNKSYDTKSQEKIQKMKEKWWEIL